jgi:hypothetical protein
MEWFWSLFGYSADTTESTDEPPASAQIVPSSAVTPPSNDSSWLGWAWGHVDNAIGTCIEEGIKILTRRALTPTAPEDAK